jgi:UDP-2,3-diacylglucosamine pyrophosphatase LpxH
VTGPVVVAGDVHLGAANSNADAFNAFLDDLHRDHETLSEVVLLGDVWDLVRRDPFGCAWETHETIARLQRLAAAVPVTLVFGNHDTYLERLDPSRYAIEFADDYAIEQAGTHVWFCHGNAFDRFQFDALSRALSGPGDRGDIDPTNGRKDPVVAAAREWFQAGRARVSETISRVAPGLAPAADRYPRRERRAHAYLDSIPADKLVYGHTHAPYVHDENVAANPGSWKSTAPVHNTYLRLDAGHLELYRYRPSGEDDRLA